MHGVKTPKTILFTIKHRKHLLIYYFIKMLSHPEFDGSKNCKKKKKKKSYAKKKQVVEHFN